MESGKVRFEQIKKSGKKKQGLLWVLWRSDAEREDFASYTFLKCYFINPDAPDIVYWNGDFKAAELLSRYQQRFLWVSVYRI